MRYSEIYKFCLDRLQASDSSGAFKPITIFEIVRELEDNIAWLDQINIHPIECIVGDPHGHYELHGNRESRWEDDSSWVALVTFNADEKVLNPCKRRFVQLKELVHIFDDDSTHTDTVEKLQELLEDIEIRPVVSCPAYLTEILAKWKALALFVPKPFRDSVKAALEANDTTPYEAALKFRIPEDTVSALISDDYDFILENLTSE